MILDKCQRERLRRGYSPDIAAAAFDRLSKALPDLPSPSLNNVQARWRSKGITIKMLFLPGASRVRYHRWMNGLAEVSEEAAIDHLAEMYPEAV